MGGMKMPKFHGPHFGGGVKGDVDAEMPDAHIDGGGKIDLDAGVDVETPDVTAKVDGPDVDVSAGIDADVSGDVDFKGGVGVELKRDRSHSHSDSDDDKEKKKKDKKSKGSFNFGMKMPKFHGPHFGGRAKGEVDAEMPDAHIDGGGKIDLDAGVDVETPDVTAKVDVPDVDVSA